MNEPRQPTGAFPSGASSGGGDPITRAREHADIAKEKATEAAHSAADAASQAADRLKASAQETGERVKAQATAVADQAKERGLAMLTEQKGRVASEIRACSAAARRAADRLEEESDTNLSGYVASAAEHLDRLGRRIEERDLGQLLDDAEDLARRRPEVFLGGMFVAGLAAARFLKASKAKRRRDRAEETGMQSPGYVPPPPPPLVSTAMPTTGPSMGTASSSFGGMGNSNPGGAASTGGQI